MDQYLRRLSFKNPLHLCAVGFGSGLISKAPGTWGTLAALPLMALLQWLLPLYAFAGVLIIGFIFGVYCCEKSSQVMGVHDHGGIVWDEFIGLGITMAFVPLSLTSLVSSFILFRLFDIFKPWVIGWLDKNTRGGFGIMIDDVAAGLIAGIAEMLVFSFIF